MKPQSAALAICLTLACAGCTSRDALEVCGAEPRSEEAAPAFPADWCGSWTGTLAMLGDSKFGPVTMTLEIAPISEGRWSWTIVYDGEFGRQVRPYELNVVDAATGRFAIDERNGIVIPKRLLGGTLYTTFEVMGSRIESRETLAGVGTDAAILVEMATVATADVVVTGGQSDRQVPEVRCSTPRSVQRGMLRRR